MLASDADRCWHQGTPANYVDWAPGEPNDINFEGFVSTNGAAESAVEMDFRASISRAGEWNDDSTRADNLLFPLCNAVAYDEYSGGSGRCTSATFDGQCTSSVSSAGIAPPMVWGTGQTASFNLKICIDHVDTLFFQDDRLWLTYGGQYAAAGAHDSCPERYIGKAYVSNEEWDISGLADCEQGVGCPVSKTFTDRQFRVPMGCQNVDVQAQKNQGRGIISTFAPSLGNGFRGEIELSDEGFGGADVYDVTVTLSCQGGGSSTPVLPVRLSCTHASQTSECRMGRVELYSRNALHADGRTRGTWGTLCGHYVWDNENA